MMRLLIKLFFVAMAGWLLGGGTVSAQPATTGDGLNQGNALYAAGNFAGAAAAYEGQVRRGEYTANLFYNLGDAYYRLGERGRAILNYQRALILDPSHAEATANLAFVGGTKPGASTGSSWSAAFLPWLTAGCGWLAIIGLVITLSARRYRRFGLTCATMGLLACATGAVAIWWLNDGAGNKARAVIIADGAPALYAPADNSKVIIKLPEGAEVRVLSDQGAWIYVLLGDGSRAWLAAAKMERVVPR